MNQDRSGWIIGGLVIAFLVALYLISAYDDIFERRIAYLFDPESDDVYVIELAPKLSKYHKWEVFFPFKSLHYTEPDGAEYIGKLHSKIADFQANLDLLKNDPVAWNQKQDRENENLIRDLSRETVELEFLDVEYFPRPIQDASVYISETLAQVFKSREIKSNEILVVDAVIARRTVAIQSTSMDKPASLSIVRKALLFQGSAAYVLSELGLQ
jgi:hypothetical protein